MSKTRVYLEMVKQSATYGAATTARRAVGLLMVPLYTRYLTPTDYGILEMLDLALHFGSLFLGMRLGESLLYFYFRAETKEEKDQALSTTMLAAALAGGVGLILGWSFARQWSNLFFGSEQYALFIRLAAVQLCAVFPLDVGFSYLRARNEAALYAAIDVARMLVALCAIVVLLVGFGRGVEAFVWTNAAVTLASAVALTIYALAPIRVSFRAGTFVSVFRYGAPLMLHGLGMLVINWGDRAFLRRSVPLSTIGLYSLAYKIGMAVSYAHQPFETYWRAQVFHLLKLDTGKRVYETTLTYLLFALTLVAMTLLLFLDPLIDWFVGPDFRSAGVYVPWIAGIYLARAIGDYFRTIIRVEAKTGREARITLVSALICLAGYAVLIPAYQVWGAIAATGICFASALVMSWHEAQKIRSFQFEYGRMAAILACAAAIAAVFRVLRPDDPGLQIPIAIVCLAIYPATLFLTGTMNNEERQLVRSAALSLVHRVSRRDPR